MISRSTSHLRFQNGMALVLVLGTLVLLSILVVAFVASVKTEKTSSTSYASSSDVKQRAQIAVNMAIAQIREASSSANVAWASQPGLIRTFDATGAPVKSYKLYSSGTMIADSAFDPNTQNDPAATQKEIPADWKSRPSEYTDLNQPALAEDPAGAFKRDNVFYTPNYPILDPGAIGTVKGFSIDGNSSTPPDYSSTDPVADNPAPMPVQWLYILKDGAIRAMDPTSRKIPDASDNNPVVSRMAFWTDDETCKVNINTAAGDEWGDTLIPGSFMDMPRANNAFESKLRFTQPVMHEYQRYPGHPATTYLSAVFPTMSRADIGSVVPKVGAGGSQGGTINTYSGNSTTVAALPFSDGLPLYASVDELRFVRSTTARTNQDSLFTPARIEQAKFFLTTNSRAPELNLFNKPRVSMWPEPADPTKRTAFDKSIAFCSTIAGEAFYFVRNDPASPTSDYTNYTRNQDLYAYLQDLTSLPVPGFGGSFLEKYPVPTAGKPSERDQILTEIFDYIRSGINLVDGQPGATVYAGPKLTNMKVWAMGGPGQVIPIQIGNTMGFGRTETLYEPILHIRATQTDVDPAALAFYDKYDAAYALNPDGILKGQLIPAAPGRKHENANLARLFTRKIQVALLFSTFSVAHGPSRFVPNLFFEVEGLNSLKVAGQTPDFGGDIQSTSYGTHAVNHEYAWGSFSTFANLFWQRPSNPYAAAAKKSWGTDPKTQYPFISKSISLPGLGAEAKSPLTLSSGDMKLNVYAADLNGNKGALVQTIHFNFPATTFPAPFMSGAYALTFNNTPPQYNDSPTVKSVSTTDDTYIPASPDAATMVYAGYSDVSWDNGSILRSVTRGLGAAGVKGDLRLIAATKNVPATFFTPLPGYVTASSTVTPAPVASGAPPPPNYKYDFHYQVSLDVNPLNPLTDGMVCGSERVGNLGDMGITYAGDLVAGVTYPKHVTTGVYAYNLGPAVSWGTTAAILKGLNGNDAPGDWDAGMGSMPDGPFINKADEGEIGNAAYSSYDYDGSNGTLFSPNRQVPSPGILGSLSTGVISEKPWQTLLFCPNPPAKSQHPGFASPPDHLWLDLFTMPVVEPYAISEPFSTAGKINMNYQIVPFTNIERSTGMQAVLRSTRVTAIPTADGMKYKFGAANPLPYRIPVDIGETLKGFQKRFDANNIFRSASQICEMFLIPEGQGATIDDIATWWDGYKLTADNLRENPYSNLYARLTTKSNTYTVHVRVQSLKKLAKNDPATWNETSDKIVGDYRGSFTIERYIDPNLATYNAADPLTDYMFRTLSTKQFTQ